MDKLFYYIEKYAGCGRCKKNSTLLVINNNMNEINTCINCGHKWMVYGIGEGYFSRHHQNILKIKEDMYDFLYKII